MKSAMLLTKKDLFCTEYVKDFNATRAAIAAGYAEKSAGVAGSRLLKDVYIASRVKDLSADKIEKVLVSTEYVLNGLKEVAKRCMQPEPVMKFNYETKTLEQETDADGNLVYKFDSQGANRALELIGKHTGAFEADNRQKQNVIMVKIGD